MAIQHSTPAHASTSHAHASHAAKHAASKAKPSLSADEGEGGFAAMLRAQPAAEKDADPAEKSRAEAKKSDDGSKDGVESKDGKDKDEKKTAKQEVDPNALTAWTPPPSTASLADKTPADDPLSALRKAAGKGKGGNDALAALGAQDADKGKADPLATLALGKGALGRAEITAALAKADEAVKAATDARDSLAALLPQPDPVAIQAGSIGASPSAVQDPNQGLQQAQQTPPAQATLAMPPQAPSFAPALGHQIDVWMKDGVQHAEVQLSPQELGPIRVRIELEGSTTRVHMAADVASTRDALQQAIPQLSDALGQVGISLSGGGVSDQPAFSQAQAQANADGGFGGGRQSGGRDSGGNGGQGGDPLGGLAPAPRPVAQRRGLLDAYA